VAALERTLRLPFGARPVRSSSAIDDRARREKVTRAKVADDYSNAEKNTAELRSCRRSSPSEIRGDPSKKQRESRAGRAPASSFPLAEVVRRRTRRVTFLAYSRIKRQTVLRRRYAGIPVEGKFMGINIGPPGRRRGGGDGKGGSYAGGGWFWMSRGLVECDFPPYVGGNFKNLIPTRLSLASRPSVLIFPPSREERGGGREGGREGGRRRAETFLLVLSAERYSRSAT
jgi:hypothetical protein